MKVGVLALQGAFIEHIKMVKACGHDAVEVRNSDGLCSAQALIIPGGESTTILKLMKAYGIDGEIKRRAVKGMPVYGTCAGCIIVAKEIEGRKQQTLSLIDISVCRNAYGRQIDSFEAELEMEGRRRPFHGVFIRAPKITGVGKDVKVIARYKGEPVLVREKNVLAGTFHPELTKDLWVHRLFLGIGKEEKNN